MLSFLEKTSYFNDYVFILLLLLSVWYASMKTCRSRIRRRAVCILSQQALHAHGPHMVWQTPHIQIISIWTSSMHKCTHSSFDRYVNKEFRVSPIKLNRVKVSLGLWNVLPSARLLFNFLYDISDSHAHQIKILHPAIPWPRLLMHRKWCLRRKRRFRCRCFEAIEIPFASINFAATALQCHFSPLPVRPVFRLSFFLCLFHFWVHTFVHYCKCVVILFISLGWQHPNKQASLVREPD
jgi:hypothetical protein